MNTHRKTNKLKKLLAAVAVLSFTAFLATAEAQSEGTPDTEAKVDAVKTAGETPMPRYMDEEFFNKLDANDDGVLSRDELPARHRFGRRGMGRRGFERADTYNDGALSRDEMPARRRFGRRGKGHRRAGWMDDDGTGKGTFVPPRMDEETFKRLDTNNDGVLSRDEFSAGPRFGRRGKGRQ